MKNLVKIFALVAALFVASQAAHASTLYGQIGFTGTVTKTATGFTFNSAQTFTGNGDFASYNGAVITPQAFDMSFAVPNAPTSGSLPGEELFRVSNGTNFLAFVVTGYTFTTVGGVRTYVFTGTLVEYKQSCYGVANPPASCKTGNSSPVTTLTFKLPADGGASPRNYDASLTSAPEPNSLLLLGTGLVGAAGMVVRRRRTV